MCRDDGNPTWTWSETVLIALITCPLWLPVLAACVVAVIQAMK